MKFRIQSTRYDESPEQVLENYPMLKNFNHAIETKPVIYPSISSRGDVFTTNETYGYVNVDSLEQLIALKDVVGHYIVISEHPAINCKGEYCIEIYDDWRE